MYCTCFCAANEKAWDTVVLKVDGAVAKCMVKKAVETWTVEREKKKMVERERGNRRIGVQLVACTAQHSSSSVCR